MKCSDWMSVFLDQEEALAKKYPEWIDATVPGDAADRFFEMHDSTQEEVEDAIRTFSRDGIWPELTQKAGAMVRVRLTAAHDYVDALQFAHRNFFFPLPAKDWPRRRWIEWFLIDVWHGVEFGRIHGSFESLRRADNADKPAGFSHN